MVSTSSCIELESRKSFSLSCTHYNKTSNSSSLCLWLCFSIRMTQLNKVYRLTSCVLIMASTRTCAWNSSLLSAFFCCFLTHSNKPLYPTLACILACNFSKYVVKLIRNTESNLYVQMHSISCCISTSEPNCTSITSKKTSKRLAVSTNSVVWNYAQSNRVGLVNGVCFGSVESRPKMAGFS